MKNKIENRFKYLYQGERFSIILFIPLSFIIHYAFPNLQLYSLLSFWISFFLLELILIQGAYYWYSKWWRLTTENKSTTPIRTVRLLKKTKIITIGMIILSIIVFFIDVYIHYPFLPIGGFLVSGFIFIFAILEFINYFYIQLSYDNPSDIRFLLKTKKFKRSCLRKDFKRIA
ncbi:general stress protein [Oceanobacillus chungangensis]|uniref:General stress protein n=1 Tax=Oceanobacillus chungangensis TaxID=1229152 RepID=A0A3D8PN51_9BACI|nr:general stress protein [Oceanobacillus chungangensis]RDW16679.1 general stress protein [Oceanobacillus chungangensis]